MKKLLVMLLCACMILSFAACRKGNEPSNVPKNGDVKASEKEITTTIWTDSQNLEAGIAAAVEGFKSEHPTYTINIEAFPGSERPQKLALAKESGTLPSLFLTGFFTSADEIHQGTIKPVTGIINDIYKNDMSETVLKMVSVNGDYYMVPLFTSSQGFLYNADMFKAAGLEDYVTEDKNAIACWTLDEFDNVILPKLKSYLSGSGKYVMTMYCANEQNDTYLHNLLRIYDGYVFKNSKCVAAEDENVVKALEKIKKWINLGYTNSDTTTRLWTDCNSDFRNQMCAISAGQFQSYLNHLAAFNKGEAKAFDVRVAAIPVKRADGTDTGAMHQYTYGFAMMNVDADQTMVASEFLKWLGANSVKYMPGMINGVPACNSVVNELKDENPIYSSYQDAEKYLFDFMDAAPGWVATRATFYPEIQSHFSGQKSARQALADYMKNANEIIKEYSDNSLVLNK